MDPSQQTPSSLEVGEHTTVAENYCPSCEESFPQALARCPFDNSPLVRLELKKNTLVGAVLNSRYRLDKRIGIGGMGTVYLANDLEKQEAVAVKVIRGHLSDDLDAVKRFLREAKLASRVSHRHIVELLDFGQTEESMLYIVLELIRGETLEEALQRSGYIEVAQACVILMHVLEALSCAHERGIVHRDLKPSNVILCQRTGDAKVLDFGLAKSLGGEFSETNASYIMGTPAYLAPEVILESRVTPSADLYAAGVLLYELLDGRVPFDSDETAAVLMAHAYRDPPAFISEIPHALAAFVWKLLAKRPEKRFSDAASARKALEKIVRGLAGQEIPGWLEAKTSEWEGDDGQTINSEPSFEEVTERESASRFVQTKQLSAISSSDLAEIAAAHEPAPDRVRPATGGGESSGARPRARSDAGSPPGHSLAVSPLNFFAGAMAIIALCWLLVSF